MSLTRFLLKAKQGTPPTSEEEEEPATPTKRTEIPSCWTCHVALGSTNDDEICCYRPHPHPVLTNVSLCSVCVEEFDNVEEEDTCTGCGTAADTVFLCDTVHCSHQFCQACVTRALGEHVDLTASDEPWYCLACSPPTPPPPPLPPRRTLTQALEAMQVAEDKKQEALTWLDHSPETRAAMAQELDTPEQVQEEFEAWQAQIQDHLCRLDDFITSLQDELELGMCEMYG